MLDELQEDDHHGLVLVACTSSGLPLQEWVDFVQRTTRETVGQAATYILDVDAIDAFNE